MTSNDTQVGQLVLNLVEGRDAFNELARQGLNANELYLVSNDDVDPVVSVDYVSSGTPKLSYTTEGGETRDIISIGNLKTSLGLSGVASDGLYTSLTSKPQINGVELSGNKTTSDLGIVLSYTSDSITNKPQINGVTLSGNKTTSDLGIAYSDLSGLPSIPEITSTYIQGNTGKGLTSAGVDQALSNYTPKTRSVTGTGALAGGGQLTNDVTITHTSAPSGLTTAAIKIGVDSYGHVCAGSGITASDIGAIPLASSVEASATALDGSNTYLTVFAQQSETLGFSVNPSPGKMISIQYCNESGNDITLTIPVALVSNTYVNGAKISSDYALNVPNNTSKRLDLILVVNGTNAYGFVNIF